MEPVRLVLRFKLKLELLVCLKEYGKLFASDFCVLTVPGLLRTRVLYGKPYPESPP